MPTQVNAGAPFLASASPVSPAGNIRLALFMALPELLSEFGQDPQTVLAAVGLNPGLLGQPDVLVPFENVDRLLQHSRDATGCEHFGLLLGQRVRLSLLGALGFAMKSAENVATALADLSRYRALHDQSALITLERDGELVSLRYLVTQPAVAEPDQIYDYAVAVGCSLLRDLCGQAWKPSRVMFRREKPARPAPYEKFFRCQIIFDNDWAGLEFHSRWLGVAPAGADPLLYQHMLREIRELDDAARDSAEDLISSLRLLLYKRHCNQGEAAAMLGINTRTLRRHLTSAGTTFRAELEAVRFQRARVMLEKSGLSALETAEILGYADLSTFSHAFKRWSGVSPAHWRRSAGSRGLA